MAQAVRGLVSVFRLLALSEGTYKKYGGDFKIAFMAAQALGLDPFCLSSDDLSFLAVFHALGHSIHSLDSFFSAISAVYKEMGKELPRDEAFQATKKGLKRAFVPIDEVRRAFPISLVQAQRVLASLDPRSPEDTVFGFWLSFSLIWALRPDCWKQGRLKWCDIECKPNCSFAVRLFAYKGSTHHGPVVRQLPPMDPSSKVDPSFWLASLILSLPSELTAPQKAVFIRPARAKGHPSYVLADPTWFTAKLRSIFKTFDEPPPANLTAYSTRRGGATAYAKAGLTTSTIKEVLRHKNDATTETYIQLIASETDSAEIAKTLTQRVSSAS